MGTLLSDREAGGGGGAQKLSKYAAWYFRVHQFLRPPGRAPSGSGVQEGMACIACPGPWGKSTYGSEAAAHGASLRLLRRYGPAQRDPPPPLFVPAHNQAPTGGSSARDLGPHIVAVQVTGIPFSAGLHAAGLHYPGAQRAFTGGLKRWGPAT